jgi:hypothetical protein
MQIESQPSNRKGNKLASQLYEVLDGGTSLRQSKLYVAFEESLTRILPLLQSLPLLSL